MKDQELVKKIEFRLMSLRTRNSVLEGENKLLREQVDKLQKANSELTLLVEESKNTS